MSVNEEVCIYDVKEQDCVYEKKNVKIFYSVHTKTDLFTEYANSP